MENVEENEENGKGKEENQKFKGEKGLKIAEDLYKKNLPGKG